MASIGSTVTSVQHDVSMMQSVVEERRKGEDQLKDICSHCFLLNSALCSFRYTLFMFLYHSLDQRHLLKGEFSFDHAEICFRSVLVM